MFFTNTKKSEQHYLEDKNFLKPWMADSKFILVTKENIEEVTNDCLNSPSKHIALDTETDSLNTSVFNGKTVATISGFSVCAKDNVGYYFPVNHLPPYDNFNLEDSLVRKFFDTILNADLIVIFHNAKYDQEVLQFNGGEPYGGRKVGSWDDVKKWEDTLILAYLGDTKGRKGLKHLSSVELNREMIKYNDLFREEDKNKNFRTLPPNNINTLAYAAGDAICTFALFFKIKDKCLNLHEGKNQNVVYFIEKLCLTATRWMERCRIKVDVPLILDLIKLTHKEFMDTISNTYSELNKYLKRDITPLSFLLLKEYILKQNPSLEYRNDSSSLNDLWIKAEKDEEKMKKSMLSNSLESRFFPEIYKALLNRVDNGTQKASYDIKSSLQLGQLFQELDVKGLELSDKGNIKTNEDAMNKILESNKDFPFFKNILKVRKLEKALSTYLYHMYENSCKDFICYDCGASFNSGEYCPKCNSKNIEFDYTVRIPFNGHKTDTGRFAVKTSKNDDGYAKFPLHSMPSTYDPENPECYKYLRKALKARKGFITSPCDYSGVELRIVTNLSKEKKWLKEYFRCSKCETVFQEAPLNFCPVCKSDKIGDLHTLTTLSIYGEESRKSEKWGDLRQKGKSINFALCYGGSGAAVDRVIHCGKNEAFRIKDKFDKTYNELFEWWKQTIEFGRKHGYVLTAFNRKYPLPDINHEDGKFRSKAERNAINAPIQGTSADITKAAMGLAYLKFKQRGWVDPYNTRLDKVKMLVTMHDELVFEIQEDIVEEAIKEIENAMIGNKFIKALNWKVPIAMTVELGDSWDASHLYYEYLYGLKPWPEDVKKYFSKETLEKNTLKEEESVKQDIKKINVNEKIFRSMSVGLCTKIAEALFNSQDEDGEYLRLFYDDGLTVVELSLPKHDIKVNFEKFKQLVE